MSRLDAAAPFTGAVEHEIVSDAIATPPTATDSQVPDREAVRADYEGLVLSVNQICTSHRITRGRLSAMIKQGGWTPRRPKAGASSARLIARMFKVLEQQVTKMEADMKLSDGKEIVLIGSMARTLGKLIELDARRSKPGPRRRAATKSMMELREKVAKRIEQLNQG